MALSPMMQQYLEIRGQHKDCILFFRLGDFYEMFFEDAKLVSRELEITLTGKNCGLEERAPMCGVPYHAAEAYIGKLLEKGYKVAICEQTEDPSKAKGLVKRDVVRIMTPGTNTIKSAISDKENLYIASIFQMGKTVGIAYGDITTGQMYTTSFNDSIYFDNLISELVKISPKEILLTDEILDRVGEDNLRSQVGGYINVIDESYFTLKTCTEAILSQFNMVSLMPIGIEDKELSIIATGSLFLYLFETQKQNLSQIKHLEYIEVKNHMSLDKATIRNLELLETLYSKDSKGSLLGVLDKTSTAMGSRKLKSWIREPLNNSELVNERLSAVKTLSENLLYKNDIRENLKQIYDFERLTGRIASGRANGKDLIALKSTLAVLPDVKELLDNLDSELIRKLNDSIECFTELHALIEDAIVDDPSFTIKEGGIIKSGYSKELDELKDSISGGKTWIANLENEEREKTGIKTLKVGYNRVFGYYLEVTKLNVSKVPEQYIRKQTLTNCERYITPELKEMENTVLNAETKINDLEYRLFDSLRESIEPYIRRLQVSSDGVAILDVLVSFADVSQKNSYIMPIVNDSYEMNIEEGRHPAIEQILGQGQFVPNDLSMNNVDQSMLIITGPNMSGKSTYMRQTALIVLMAQIGCFVPCKKAEIGVVDRVFTRIGASDNLSQGQSTFFVEMSELANILRNAKDRSLIILDEIGRGTSTFDGLSIAWAAVEYLSQGDVKVRTLFATHYHELTVMEKKIDCVKNFSIDVSEKNGNIVFLHRIKKGPASKSYGIHVAKIAGIPKSILKNAQIKLMELESSETKETEPLQLSIFDNEVDESYEAVKFRLEHLDVNNITPMRALSILEELKREIEE
ncbi:MAG: DNA mismatch repair protein MutS [Peptostreptococcaceae bacterium]|nr:DNA mismatch repair protein MutS [Peptostreptococcaceae bacterium]